jgi:hypothetical protein
VSSPKSGFPEPLSPDLSSGRDRRRGLEDKIEDIFLSYVNLSMKDKPENLLSIYDNIEKNINFYGDYRGLVKQTIENIVLFAKCNSKEEAENIFSELNNSPPQIMNGASWVDCAFESVFGYLYKQEQYQWEDFDGTCSETCLYGHIREQFYDTVQLSGPNRLRCHECDQLFFIHIVDSIIQGDELSEILGFKQLLKSSFNCVRWATIIVDSNDKVPFKEMLEEALFVIPDGFIRIIENNFEQNVRDIFHDFIISITGYSLIHFLIKNDRRKIKKCEQCNTIFISQRINNRIKFCPKCSGKNKMTKDKRREYQREYRKKIREKKEKVQREDTIKHYMKHGFSKEEAVKIIEADSML